MAFGSDNWKTFIRRGCIAKCCATDVGNNLTGAFTELDVSMGHFREGTVRELLDCSTPESGPLCVLQGNSAAIPTNALQQYSVEALPQPGELDVASYQSCLRDGAEIPIIATRSNMPSASKRRKISSLES